MNKILEVSHISKEFGQQLILNDINFSILPGQIYGLLGPNGAGKTTLMKIIISLLEADRGNVSIGQFDLEIQREAALKEVGSLIETPAFYEHLTAKQVLELQAAYLGCQVNVKTILDKVGLKNSDKAVKAYSLGMKQRLGIGRALVGNPQLLILDEPINGLDPQGVREMRQLLQDLAKNENVSILISSHILSEIAQVADKIGIIKEGQLIKEVEMAELNAEHIDLESYFLDQVSFTR
ncbi:ABC transporter ATP-binding protein [Vaginisenegalia massiliensis]|uniref:ABC transporter ATP-binding protein n=1 Tax=Vaginisenegalia massiliensis TaxID=2058294 RepID=UPI000F549451|nr:ATP-binding cassette domain-containing protein [Vaginisenegalia massiliensis]